MKKLFLMLALCAMTTNFIACDKEETPKQDQENPGNENENTLKFRIKSYTDYKSRPYVYSYDEAGRVTLVDFNNGEELWKASYSEDGKTITFKYNDTETSRVVVLGDDGLAKEYIHEGKRVFLYTYDNDGYCTQISKKEPVDAQDAVVVSDITYDAKHNLIGWTKPYSSSNTGWATKKHTYTDYKNLAGIHYIYSEENNAAKWLQELGWFGKPSAYLCETNVWDYSTNTSLLEYEFDDNGFVTKVTKSFVESTSIEVNDYIWEYLE